MKLIESSQNKLYKDLKKLATNTSARSKTGKIILEGIHVCQMFLAKIGAPEYCIVTDVSLTNNEVAELVKECQAQGVKVLNVPEHLYRGLSSVDTGVSVIFISDTPQVEPPDLITENTLFIDRLQDPGNLGTILRTAVAAGVKEVYCANGTVSAWSPKVVRSAMGAHFALNVYENQHLAKLISSTELPVLATSSHVDKTIYETDLNKEVIWLVGQEGRGLSKELMDLATNTVSIPHKGEIESLNVAVATSVCLFEQLRQAQLK